jgi:copper homeostasis protein (lipoprotein)
MLMMHLKRFLLLIGAVAMVLSGCTAEEPQVEEVHTTSRVQTAVMVGMFQYMADAPGFTDCSTGKRFPVAMAEDYLALERAYLESQSEPGELRLVTFEGHIEARPATEGNGLRDFVIVKRFEQLWPGESCEKATVKTLLKNTYWKLVELGGNMVQVHADQREVHVLLRPDNTRITGFSGCNELIGNYYTEADELTIRLKVPPMAACPYLDEETEFVHALQYVTRFRIHGESMDLLGDAVVLARFKAMYFK